MRLVALVQLRSNIKNKILKITAHVTRILLFFIVCGSLSACLSTKVMRSPAARAAYATDLATKKGWKPLFIHTSKFTLQAYGSPKTAHANLLTIYIEGDGLAWLSAEKLSTNPTPMNPIGLKMALRDPSKTPVAYIARPCQYVTDHTARHCCPAYWSHLRFAPEVIQSMNQAVSYLKHYYHAQQLVLFGYSGGGTVATLLAAQRTDVKQLITVAAVLDIDEWVKRKHLSQLDGSLNPADAWRGLLAIPQTHWVGGKDTVVPKEVAFAFAQRFPSTQQPSIRVIPSFDHSAGWTRAFNNGVSCDS